MPPDPNVDPLGYWAWVMQNDPNFGTMTPQAPMPGQLPLPGDIDDANDVMDYGKDALDFNWKMQQQLASPEGAMMRLFQYGPGAVGQGAFDPVFEYDPVSMSDYGELTRSPNGGYTVGNPQVMRYLDPSYDAGAAGDVVGWIIQNALMGNRTVDQGIMDVATAWGDPNHDLHEAAKNTVFPSNYSDAGEPQPDWEGFRMRVQGLANDAMTAQDLGGTEIHVDPETGLPAYRTETPNELTQMLMDAGFSDPRDTYDPNQWATPDDLTAEQAAMMQWLEQGQQEWAQKNRPVPTATAQWDQDNAQRLEQGQLQSSRDWDAAVAEDFGISPDSPEWLNRADDPRFNTSPLKMPTGGARGRALSEAGERFREGGGFEGRPGERTGDILNEENENTYNAAASEYAKQWRDYQMAMYEQERRRRISQGLYDQGYSPFYDQVRSQMASMGAMGIPTAMPQGGAPSIDFGDMSGWAPQADNSGFRFARPVQAGRPTVVTWAGEKTAAEKEQQRKNDAYRDHMRRSRR